MSETKDIAKAQANLVDGYQNRQLMQRLRQKQQRQILAMMGITAWVRSTTATITISSIVTDDGNNDAILALPTSQSPVISSHQIPQSTDIAITEPPISYSNDEIVNSDLTIDAPADDELSHNFFDEKAFENKAFDGELEDGQSSIITEPNEPTIAPFALEGARFQDWVLIVDVSKLSKEGDQLWRNISTALTLSCTPFSFPICSGMTTQTLANASFAGYIFNLGREDIHIGALTELPEGVLHPNIRPLPTLDAMLEDASLKRDFWQQISTRSL